ncbi:hypothetical protein ABQE69_10050 [Mycolicibacillus trivialis]
MIDDDRGVRERVRQSYAAAATAVAGGEPTGPHVGCIAGALSRGEYLDGLAAGFTEVSVEFTHRIADGMHGAIIRAAKPG